jgi:DNA polymerase-3 subunit delta
MFYIFHGDDEHSQRKFLIQLQEKLGDMTLVDLNTTRFEGVSLTMSQLRHACDSIPFLSDRRLVIVNDLLARQPDYMDSLLDYVLELPETTRLVFCESRLLKETHPMIRLAMQSDSGYIKSFIRLEGREISLWIQNRVRERDGRISPKAAHLLAINVGNNLALLENEIEKLILYRGEELIDVGEVSLLCPYVAEASIFDLVDALGSRHGRTTAELLQSKLADGTDPFNLFGMIVRQYRLLIQVKEMAAAGRKPPEIGKTLNIPGFVAGKLYQQSHNYDLPQLEQVYAHLLDMDVRVKTGKTEMSTALNLLVAGLVT